MGREALDFAERRHAQLGARTAKLFTDDPFLDDAATLFKFLYVGFKGNTRQLKLHGLKPMVNQAAL